MNKLKTISGAFLTLFLIAGVAYAAQMGGPGHNNEQSFSSGATFVLPGDQNITIDGSTDPRTVSIGVLRLNHLPAVGNENNRSIFIDIDMNSIPDTHGMVIDYLMTGLATNEAGMGIELNGITSDSSGGEFQAIRVEKSGTGSGEVHALHLTSGVIPVHQATGTSGALEQAFKYTGAFTDVTAAFNAAGTDVEIFTSDNDIVYIGDAALFDVVEVTLAITAANPGIIPVFEFSDGASGRTTFSANDGTNGFRTTGNISWDSGNLVGMGWAVDTVNAVANKYWIRITRTTNNLGTVPTEDTIQKLSTTDYFWTEEGHLDVRSIQTADVTADPCGSYNEGTLFYNATANIYCYCSAANADLKVSDDNACF